MILSRVLFNNLYHCDKYVATVNFHKRTDYRSIVLSTPTTKQFNCFHGSIVMSQKCRSMLTDIITEPFTKIFSSATFTRRR